MRSVLPVIFAIGLAASAASAQTTPAAGSDATSPTATPAPTTNTPTNNDDIVSCRYEKTTGSNFAKRICHTQREWHQMTVDSRDMMDNINAHDRMGNGLSGGN